MKNLEKDKLVYQYIEALYDGDLNLAFKILDIARKDKDLMMSIDKVNKFFVEALEIKK